MIEIIAQVAATPSIDPFTAIFNRNWADVGGWSLFIGLVILSVTSFMKGWIVPGWMYKEQGKTLDQAMEQNRKLLVVSDIVAHFFKSTAPKGGDKDDLEAPR